MRQDDVWTEQTEHVICILDRAACVAILKKQYLVTLRQIACDARLALHLVKRLSSEVLIRADRGKHHRHLHTPIGQTIPFADQRLRNLDLPLEGYLNVPAHLTGPLGKQTGIRSATWTNTKNPTKADRPDGVEIRFAVFWIVDAVYVVSTPKEIHRCGNAELQALQPCQHGIGLPEIGGRAVRVYAFYDPVPFVAVSRERLKQFVACVPVSVDKPRHHHFPARVDHLARTEARPQLSSRSDGGDPIPDDRNRAVVHHAPVPVHGDDRAIGD